MEKKQVSLVGSFMTPPPKKKKEKRMKKNLVNELPRKDLDSVKTDRMHPL